MSATGSSFGNNDLNKPIANVRNANPIRRPAYPSSGSSHIALARPERYGVSDFATASELTDGLKQDPDLHLRTHFNKVKV